MSALFSICVGVSDPLDTLTMVLGEFVEEKEKPAETQGNQSKK